MYLYFFLFVVQSRSSAGKKDLFGCSLTCIFDILIINSKPLDGPHFSYVLSPRNYPGISLQNDVPINVVLLVDELI